MATLAASTHTIEPYTQVPNYYFDTLKPNLSSTEANLCDVVIRMTYGWHRRSARISIPTFIAKTGMSRSAIIAAKATLVESGLLVLLDEGGGRTTSRYMLDLYYDRVEEVDVEDTIDTLTIIPSESKEIAPPFTVQDAAAATLNMTSSSNEPAPAAATLDNTPDEEPSPANRDAASPSTSPISGDNIAEDPLPVVECQDSDTISDAVSPPVADLPAVEGAPISDSHVASEPVATAADVQSRGPDSEPPPSKDLDLSIISINKLQTEATNHEVTPEAEETTSTRQQVANVRSNFKSLFPDAIDKADWPLFGWAVSTYGVEVCLNKLRLLGEYRKISKIDNPKGLFRIALTRDYQPNKSVQTKLRAEESARRAKERSRRESQERQAMIQKFNYEDATASLQKLMETLN